MPEHQEIGQRDFSTLQTRNLHRKAIFNMTCINDKYENLWKCLEPWNVTCISAPALDMKITELLPMIISESRLWIDSMEKGEGFDTMPEHLPGFYQEIGQDGVMRVWNTGMTKKKKKGKERTQQNLYRPKSVPKKTVPRKPKPTPAELNDPESLLENMAYSNKCF